MIKYLIYTFFCFDSKSENYFGVGVIQRRPFKKLCIRTRKQVLTDKLTDPLDLSPDQVRAKSRCNRGMCCAGNFALLSHRTLLRLGPIVRWAKHSANIDSLSMGFMCTFPCPVPHNAHC